jgi:hypothetical protein
VHEQLYDTLFENTYKNSRAGSLETVRRHRWHGDVSLSVRLVASSLASKRLSSEDEECVSSSSAMSIAPRVALRYCCTAQVVDGHERHTGPSNGEKGARDLPQPLRPWPLLLFSKDPLQ